MALEAQTEKFLQSKLDGFTPETGLILGSGLGFFADSLEVEERIPYDQIPGFPQSTVVGHAGNLVAGHCEGHPVLCFQGRFHYYEGYPLDKVVLPVEVIHCLGGRRLIVTNAAGGINASYSEGDLMLICDHINFLGANPLRGPNEERLGPRFPDMTEVYTPRLRDLAREASKSLGIPLLEGVYLACSGPSYETPAEIRAFQSWGADAVGMSTVPEAIVARHHGLEVLGISCITNMAAGLSDGLLSHAEVEETASRVRDSFAHLLQAVVNRL